MNIFKVFSFYKINYCERGRGVRCLYVKRKFRNINEKIIINQSNIKTKIY